MNLIRIKSSVGKVEIPHWISRRDLEVCQGLYKDFISSVIVMNEFLGVLERTPLNNAYLNTARMKEGVDQYIKSMTRRFVLDVISHFESQYGVVIEKDPIVRGYSPAMSYMKIIKDISVQIEQSGNFGVV